VHGARDIDDKNILSRGNLVGTDPLGWLEHEKKEVFFLTLIQKKPGFDGLPLELVFQDKITIPAAFFWHIECDGGTRGSIVADSNFMRRTGDILNRYNKNTP